MRKALIALVLLSLAVWAFDAAPARATGIGGVEDIAARIGTILAGDQRSPEHRARDRYRHPLETLLFFGIEPDMTVIELWPGRQGWYTEILAPLLAGKGRLYAAGFSQTSQDDYVKKSNAEFAAKLASRPDVYGGVIVTELDKGKYDIAPPGSADLVLTFRNIHNWMEDGIAQDVFDAAYRALQAGGILGVVEHRADPGTREAEDPAAKSGYVAEARVIGFAEAAGFRLEAKSEINANPKDTKDYPEGVWTLPPVLKLGETERDKYLAIGESDRMTLKFVKPDS